MFPDLPSLPAIEANQSLVFLNSHFSYGEVVPLLPNQVEVGCMHCRPAQPLPAVSYYTNVNKINLFKNYTANLGSFYVLNYAKS